jgi:hypothetical protein
LGKENGIFTARQNLLRLLLDCIIFYLTTSQYIKYEFNFFLYVERSPFLSFSRYYFVPRERIPIKQMAEPVEVTSSVGGVGSVGSVAVGTVEWKGVLSGVGVAVGLLTGVSVAVVSLSRSPYETSLGLRG